MRPDVLRESYFDILQNAENRLLFCVRERCGEPDHPYIEYDGGANAVFYRRPGQVILLDEVHPDARKAVLAAEEVLFAEFVPQNEQLRPDDEGVIREYTATVRKVEQLPVFEPQTTSKQVLNVPYDFINNEDDELMLVMDAPNGSPDDESARLVYDGYAEAMLIRNDDQIIYLPALSETARDMLDGISTVIVTEMDGEEISDVYEARVEVLDDALPIP